MLPDDDGRRIEIWDLLWRSGNATIDAIAFATPYSRREVERLVDHEWFARRGENVRIRYAGER